MRASVVFCKPYYPLKINMPFYQAVLIFCFAGLFTGYSLYAQNKPNSLQNNLTELTADICVYGATSAGVIAAYTAKMQGKSVLLIEPGTHVGGLSSGGLGYADIGNKYVVTGLARDFYRKLGQHYGKFEQWTFEPHAAKAVFMQYLQKAGITPQYNRRVVSVQKKGTVIQSIITESSVQPGKRSFRQVRAKMFIDCTYEGDLMAKAGVSYTVGREPNSLYGETYNGVQLEKHHQFPDGIDPYVVRGKKESGLLWGISSEKLAPIGSGDKKVQAYNFRICLTDSLENQIPITRPDDYDSTRFELLLRVFEKKGHLPLNYNFLKMDKIPNRKLDINNEGPFSTDMIGMNHQYPEADYATRQKIIKAHENYNKGLLYFLGNDPRVPEHIRTEMKKWGYPKDEYQQYGHWSPQMYVREARRMIGEYVMTQANCEGKTVAEDAVGMAAYTMDSHNTQRIVIEKDGVPMVKNEGDIQVAGFPPYPISYRALTPRRAECGNLLVPVCLSASHIAFGSIRMEPVFMVLAQSAAMAAVQAIDRNLSVQDVDVPALQQALRLNPLADGSTPEILLDNDITPQAVSATGAWTEQKGGIAQLGGTYGRSVLVAAPEDRQAVARYQFPNDAKGKYKLYYYNTGFAQQKAPAYRFTLQLGGAEVQLHQSTQNNHYDWLYIGQFELTGNGSAWLEVGRAAAHGAVYADAVLLVPAEKE
jgi:hypothetical protein